MNISLDLIKELREKTGAGMGDCKAALEEAGGEMDKAVEILRKKGIAKAAKRSDRQTGEGVIKILTNEQGNEGYMVEIKAETDFVVKSERFEAFSDKVIGLAAASRPETLEALFAVSFDGATVKESLDNLSGVVGEKLEISRYGMLTSGGTVAAYSHAGGRIGVLAAIDQSNRAELAREVAMQAAATNPRFVSPEEVPAEEIEKEKEIYRQQLKNEGKPEAMIEKILDGKINKFYEEVCLIKQEYIKDDKLKMEKVLGGAKVEKFIRFAL